MPISRKLAGYSDAIPNCGEHHDNNSGHHYTISDKLGRRNSHHPIWYSSGYSTLASFFIKPKLEIAEVDAHGRRIRLKIRNNGRSVARRCYGRVTIGHTKQDVLPPSQFSKHAIILPTDEDYKQVEDMNVCWSVGDNPQYWDIPKGMVETLEVAQLGWQGQPPQRFFFEIPSEGGYSEEPQPIGRGGFGVTGRYRKSRVLLQPKEYDVTVKVGAEDVDAIEKRFVLGYDSQSSEPHMNEVKQLL